MTIAIFKKPNGIKRIVAAVLAAATLISVAACGSGNSASASKESLNTTKGKTPQSPSACAQDHTATWSTRSSRHC